MPALAEQVAEAIAAVAPVWEVLVSSPDYLKNSTCLVGLFLTPGLCLSAQANPDSLVPVLSRQAHQVAGGLLALQVVLVALLVAVRRAPQQVQVWLQASASAARP